MLVVDDAYFEYVKDKNYLPGIKLFSNSKNVIVTRTFSKIYGLASLRLDGDMVLKIWLMH